MLREGPWSQGRAGRLTHLGTRSNFYGGWKCRSGPMKWVFTTRYQVSVLSVKSAGPEVLLHRRACLGGSGVCRACAVGVLNFTRAWGNLWNLSQDQEPDSSAQDHYQPVGLAAQSSQDMTWYPERGASCSGLNWFSWCGPGPLGLSRCPWWQRRTAGEAHSFSHKILWMKRGYKSWERLKATRFLKLIRFLFCPRENKDSFILEKCVNTKTSRKRGSLAFFTCL